MKATRLVVIDHARGIVFIHLVSEECAINKVGKSLDDMDSDDYDMLIIKLGYHLNQVSYMSNKELKVEYKINNA